jgi:hypothetical protein
MPTPSEYKEQREARRTVRKQKAERLKKWVPMLEVLCRKHGIEMKEIPSGYQFRIREYILNWWLPTNKIVVQYAGSGDHKEFDGEGEPGEPKVMTALKKLINVTKGAAQSKTQ